MSRMKCVSKEQFACEAIKLTNGTKYLYKQHINGIIDTLKENHHLCVADMSDEELKDYVEDEIRRVESWR